MSGAVPRIPPAVRAALRQLEQFNRQTREVQSALAALEPVRAQLAVTSKALRAVFEGERWRDAWERALPANWRGMKWEDIKRVMKLMDQTGWSLVWVPSRATLERLLVSPTRDPARRLTRFEKRIVADIERTLGTISAPEVRELREALREALATHTDGRWRAAQALTASALTASIHQFFNPPTLGGVRKKGSDIDPEEVALRRFRRAVVFRRVAEGLDNFTPREAPVPTRFNRHAVAHTIAPEQFTRANSLAGLLLGVSVAREIEYELREEPLGRS